MCKVQRRRFFVALGGAMALMVFLFSWNQPAYAKDVRVGVIVPLTGGAAEFGKWARNGVELAIAELNERTDQTRQRFVAIYEDHQMDVKQGLSAFQKLVDVDKISAVVTSGSGVVLAIAPEADRTRTLQLNYAAVSPKICGAGKFTFTLVNNADVETVEIATLAVKQLGLKKMAVLYANAAYGVTTKDSVVRSFAKEGGEILGVVAFPEGFTDLRAQLVELKSLNAPAVYFIGTIKDSGRLLKQAQELGLKTQWLTYNAFESPEIFQIAGDAAEGVIYTSSNPFDLPDHPSNAQSFLKAYEAKYAERPNIYASTAYDAIKLLALADASPDNSPEGLRNFFSAIREYQGASGLVTMDERGCVRKPVFLKSVRNGQFVVYQPQK